jgi:nucleoid DNA-binding protein
MTKADITHKIAVKTGVEQEKVKEIVQLVLDGISDVCQHRFEIRANSTV